MNFTSLDYVPQDSVQLGPLWRESWSPKHIKAYTASSVTDRKAPFSSSNDTHVPHPTSQFSYSLFVYLNVLKIFGSHSFSM